MDGYISKPIDSGCWRWSPTVERQRLRPHVGWPLTAAPAADIRPCDMADVHRAVGGDDELAREMAQLFISTLSGCSAAIGPRSRAATPERCGRKRTPSRARPATFGAARVAAAVDARADGEPMGRIEGRAALLGTGSSVKWHALIEALGFGEAGMRVLIADDDSALRHWLRGHLVRWGYDASCAPTAPRRGRALQASQPPPLALLDWNMPGVDGPSCAGRCGRRRRWRRCTSSCSPATRLGRTWSPGSKAAPTTTSSSRSTGRAARAAADRQPHRHPAAGLAARVRELQEALSQRARS